MAEHLLSGTYAQLVIPGRVNENIYPFYPKVGDVGRLESLRSKGFVFICEGGGMIIDLLSSSKDEHIFKDFCGGYYRSVPLPTLEELM
jgi:hypothetical protein